jgi:PAS domain S-box-containing protein
VLPGRLQRAQAGDEHGNGNGFHHDWEAMAAALMQLPEGVLLTDASGHIRWANGAAAEMTGWPIAQLHRMPLAELLDADELDRIAKIRGTTDPGDLRRYHCTLIARSGCRREVSISVGRSQGAGPAAAIYLIRDLQRQREIEGRLMDQLAEKHELETFKRQTSGVLHDLRHMGHVLGLTVKNFLRHHENPAFRDEALRTLDDIASQTGHLLNRLVRPSTPRPLKCEPANLGQLTRRALDLLACAGHGASVTATVTQGLDQSLDCEVDKAEMLRVIFNLLLNAYEAVQRGGSVTVRGAIESDGRHLRLVVEDTGPGLAQSYLKHNLFRAFRSTKPGGFGLGLCEAKSIVEAHGGTLEATNRDDGPGARVTIRLPARPASDRLSAAAENNVPA